MPRLFTGIRLPETVCDQLDGLQQPLPGTRWVDLDNLHITLRFAGDIDNPTADEFYRLLEDVSLVPVFTLRLRGLGTFGAKEPRLLWAGVEPNEGLSKLHRINERAARAAGLAPERRAFKPHVTLARLRYPRADLLAKFLSRHGGFVSEPFTVSHVSLMSSKPLTGGGPYIVEEDVPLAGAPVVIDEQYDIDAA